MLNHPCRSFFCDNGEEWVHLRIEEDLASVREKINQKNQPQEKHLFRPEEAERKQMFKQNKREI